MECEWGLSIWICRYLNKKTANHNYFYQILYLFSDSQSKSSFFFSLTPFFNSIHILIHSCYTDVEIFVSSTRVLPLPLPMAQLRWQERGGSVFLCGDWDVKFGVSINFPPFYGSASSNGTWRSRLPCWWADLEEAASANFR